MSTHPVDEPNHHDGPLPDGIEWVIEAKSHGVGTITVARALPSAKRRHVGPFVFLDHMGPIEIAPGVGFDVRPHPHIGLSTVTYFFQGENVHRDNMGNVQTNRPADVNVMTAGGGVVHSERADPAWRAAGGVMHGVQIWLGLPPENEDDAPSFEHHPHGTLPMIQPASGVRGRVLLGEIFGVRSPIVHPSKPVLVDLQLDPGAIIEINGDMGERAVFVISGNVALDGHAIGENHLAVLREKNSVRVVATEASSLLLLGGPGITDRFMEWNFVATSRERIDRAREAWRDQKYAKIPGDDVEFIPLPDLPRR